MSEPCVPVEELGRLVALPAGDPERRHVDSCTRCQSLLVMLRAFEQPSPGPEEAAFVAADPRLRETIGALVGGAAEAAPDRATPVRRAAPQRGGLWAPPRLAWALAVVVVVGGAGVALWRTQQPGDTMRSVPSSSDASASFTSASESLAGGGVELRWHALAGATGYRVVFYDSALREIASLSPGAVTSLRLTADALPAGLTRGALVGWQVEALAGADRIARSPTRGLRVP